MPKQEIKEIEIKNLYLWSENPRDPINTECTDYEIIKQAIEDKNSKWNLQKMLREMGNYYDFSELPTVVKINGKCVVYDGNRRLAILKYLQNQKLYSSFGGGLFFKLEPKELRELKKIPCNICDKEIALTNIERKHINNGSWGAIERDYFFHIHRGGKKSLFLELEEQVGIVRKYPKLNKRFVKEEMLTKQNLEEVGIHFDEKNGFTTNYVEQENEMLIKKIASLVDDGIVTTRINRGELKKPLLEKYPDLKDKIKAFDKTKESYILEIESNNIKHESARKTPKTKINDILFGKDLFLKKGSVNNLYLAILKVYEKNKNDDSVLPIIGMSLRLLLDVAARIYYEEINFKGINKDQFYKNFLKEAKEKIKTQETINYISLTDDWISDKYNIEGMLAKYAHGNIAFNKSDILKNSIIIADILELYFKK